MKDRFLKLIQQEPDIEDPSGKDKLSKEEVFPVHWISVICVIFVIVILILIKKPDPKDPTLDQVLTFSMDIDISVCADEFSAFEGEWTVSAEYSDEDNHRWIIQNENTAFVCQGNELFQYDTTTEICGVVAGNCDPDLFLVDEDSSAVGKRWGDADKCIIWEPDNNDETNDDAFTSICLNKDGFIVQQTACTNAIGTNHCLRYTADNWEEIDSADVPICPTPVKKTKKSKCKKCKKI
ncbi:hypothetical protein GEMRC1_005598 [Eukaryota sp. GEM-RC1]